MLYKRNAKVNRGDMQFFFPISLYEKTYIDIIDIKVKVLCNLTKETVVLNV